MNFRHFQRQFLMNFSISAAVVNNFSSVSVQFLMSFLLSWRQPLVNFREFKRQFLVSSLASWKHLLMNFRQFQRCF